MQPRPMQCSTGKALMVCSPLNRAPPFMNHLAQSGFTTPESLSMTTRGLQLLGVASMILSRLSLAKASGAGALTGEGPRLPGYVSKLAPEPAHMLGSSILEAELRAHVNLAPLQQPPAHDSLAPVSNPLQGQTDGRARLDTEPG